jgi:MoaA/NifB/PqqE/SkfB family radical SAM enzyme
MKSYLSLAKNAARSNVMALEFPYKLTFVTTYWCNYRCKTCNIWERKPKDELTLEEIQRFFHKSNQFNWIDFTGGEPWLRKDFPDIVEAALDHCPDLALIHFPTNGYLTNQIVAGVERIMRKRPRKLVISVSTDGDEAVNDHVRGIKGGWRRQIETYRQLHGIPGVQVVLGMTLSSLNANKYDDAFAAAKAECPWLTPRDYHINVFHESGHYYGNEGMENLRSNDEAVMGQIDAYRKARGFSRSPIDVLEHRYLANVERYLRSGVTPVRCQALSSSCFVDSWGQVYPCSMYDAKIASLRDYDFDLKTIWNLPKTRQLQKEIWDYKCPQCWTPCEAYQSIIANGLGTRTTPATRQRGIESSPPGTDQLVQLSSRGRKAGSGSENPEGP